MTRDNDPLHAVLHSVLCEAVTTGADGGNEDIQISIRELLEPEWVILAACKVTARTDQPRRRPRAVP